jgi:hypothetical protein
MSIESCAVNDDVTAILMALVAAGIDARRIDDDGGGGYRVSVQIDGARYTLEKTSRDLATNVVFLPWVKPEVDPRAGQMFPPLTPTHPAYRQRCLMCNEPLGNGLVVQLFVLGPATDEDRRAHHAGRKYSALQAFCHAICVQGVPASPN